MSISARVFHDELNTLDQKRYTFLSRPKYWLSLFISLYIFGFLFVVWRWFFFTLLSHTSTPVSRFRFIDLDPAAVLVPVAFFFYTFHIYISFNAFIVVRDIIQTHEQARPVDNGKYVIIFTLNYQNYFLWMAMPLFFCEYHI